MKIVTYLLGALLAAALGAAALFYFMTWQPLQAKYVQFETEEPGLRKAKAELIKYKKKEADETAWVGPVIAEAAKQLDEEIKAGKAEVTPAGAAVAVNISEDILFTPRSVTFNSASRPLLGRIAEMLSSKDVKGKQIVIANVTEPVPAQGKGKKKVLPRDARALAADRSLALGKFLEQNKVEASSLLTGAYSAKVPDTGFKIKDRKLMILITNVPSPAPAVAAPAAKPAAPQAPAVTKPTITTHPSSTTSPAAPKAVPIKPAEPKGQQ